MADLFVNLPPGRTPAQQRRDHAELVILAQRADAAGFGGLFLTEHPAAVGGATPNALTAVVDLAARTRRMQLGPAGIIGPVRHPGQVAEEIAQAAALMDGRLVAGVVKGFQPEVYAHRGLPLPSNEQYVEFLQDVRRGLDDLGCLVPLWATGSAAARLGLGLMTNPYSRGTRENVVADIAAFEDEGGAGNNVFAHLMVFVDECPAQAREVGGRAVDAYLADHGCGQTAAGLMAAGLVAVGTPEQVASDLGWFGAVGITRLGVSPLLWFLPLDAVLQTLHLLTTEVAPLLARVADLRSIPTLTT